MLTNFIRALVRHIAAFPAWWRGSWKIIAVTAIVLIAVLVMLRIALPLGLYASMKTMLTNRTGMSEGMGSFLALIFGAITISAQGYLLSWLILGRNPGHAAAALCVIGALSLGSSLVMSPFARDGASQQHFYVDHRGRYQFTDRPGISPETGLPTLPVTPDIARRAAMQRDGEKPQKITQAIESIDFFDRLTGLPMVYYWQGPNSQIELWSAPGIHPRSGEALLPVTPELVRRISPAT